MIKIVALIKRKPGMSFEAFRDYYETTHSKLGEKYLPPYCTKYLRRYLEPAGHHTGGPAPEAEHDCLVEMWFPDEAQLKAFRASVSAPDIVRLIGADEDRFIDHSRTRRYVVDEHLSWGPE
jgi:hypothetical protein